MFTALSVGSFFRVLCATLVLWTLQGCKTDCPSGRVRVGGRCTVPSPGPRDDAGVIGGGPGDADAGPGDAGQPDAENADPCSGCLANELCFEDSCYPLDACGRAFGLPCEAVGPWYIKIPNVDPGDHFGWSVAISGDGQRLALSARREDSADPANPADNNAESAGAVFVYRRDGNRWNQEAYLKALHPAAEDHFGVGLDLDSDGNTLVVGAYLKAGTGAVEVFHRTGTSWASASYLEASNKGVNDAFGLKVAVSGNGTVVAVAAPREGAVSEPTGDLAGAVYVFNRAGDLWSETDRLKASNGKREDFFGTDVSLNSDGSLLAVGAFFEDGVGNTTPEGGAAYVFARSGSSWREEVVVRPSNVQSDDRFGFRVSLSGSGDRLLVGAPRGDGPAADSGSAYLFQRTASGWTEVLTLEANTVEAGDRFGNDVVISGDGNRLAVAAEHEDSSSGGVFEGAANQDALQSGAVFLFELDGDEWKELATLKALNTGDGDRFGYAVDLSHMGGWLVAGAPWEGSDGQGADRNPADNSSPGAGAGYVYRLAP